MVESISELISECKVFALVKPGYHLKDNRAVFSLLMDYIERLGKGEIMFNGRKLNVLNHAVSRCCVCSKVKLNEVYVDFPFERVNVSIDGVSNPLRYSDGVCSIECTSKFYGISLDFARELYQ